MAKFSTNQDSKFSTNPEEKVLSTKTNNIGVQTGNGTSDLKRRLWVKSINCKKRECYGNGAEIECTGKDGSEIKLLKSEGERNIPLIKEETVFV